MQKIKKSFFVEQKINEKILIFGNDGINKKKNFINLNIHLINVNT